MIIIKERKLIALLELVKNYPDADISELLDALQLTKIKEGGE